MRLCRSGVRLRCRSWLSRNSGLCCCRARLRLHRTIVRLRYRTSLQRTRADVWLPDGAPVWMRGISDMWLPDGTRMWM